MKWQKWDDPNNEIRRITEALVGIPTISPDPEGENKCAEQIAAYLREVGLEPELWETDEPIGERRHSVACLLRGGDGKQNKTLILMSHFDTVGTREYEQEDLDKQWLSNREYSAKRSWHAQN